MPKLRCRASPPKHAGHENLETYAVYRPANAANGAKLAFAAKVNYGMGYFPLRQRRVGTRTWEFEFSPLMLVCAMTFSHRERHACPSDCRTWVKNGRLRHGGTLEEIKKEEGLQPVSHNPS